MLVWKTGNKFDNSVEDFLSDSSFFSAPLSKKIIKFLHFQNFLIWKFFRKILIVPVTYCSVSDKKTICIFFEINISSKSSADT